MKDKLIVLIRYNKREVTPMTSMQQSSQFSRCRCYQQQVFYIITASICLCIWGTTRDQHLVAVQPVLIPPTDKSVYGHMSKAGWHRGIYERILFTTEDRYHWDIACAMYFCFCLFIYSNLLFPLLILFHASWNVFNFMSILVIKLHKRSNILKKICKVLYLESSS